MKASKTKVVSVLRKAADAIRKFGWFQGNFGDKSHGFCALGAIRYANNGKILASASRAVSHVVGEEVAGFNDCTCKSRKELLGVFKLAEKAVLRGEVK